MKRIVDGDGDPCEAAERIWSEAMGTAVQSHDIMWPLWLLWGALTDRVDENPDEASVAREAMRRAAEEWLALPPESSARTAYFDRWLYEEMGYDRPHGAPSEEAQ